MEVLEATRALLEQGPLCDACLGRVFAHRSHGLANRERGRALRTTRALLDDTPYEPPDACWVCDTESDRVDEWTTYALNELSRYECRTYQVGTRVPPLIEENDRLLREDAGLTDDTGEPFKRELNREVGKRLAERLDITPDFERPDVVVLLDLTTDRITIQNNPAFVYGRYRKLVRGIPQTEWPCRACHGSGTHHGEPCENCDGTGYQYQESVEQLITPPIQDAMQGTDTTFHGAGREDIDARMLGTGRPFVVEITNPTHRHPDPHDLETTINNAQDKVEVTDLALATHDMVERVKQLPATKTYEVTLELADPLNEDDLTTAVEALRGATIKQQTPDRVAHRRADKTRTRTVHEITATYHPTTPSIELRTEGGLYVKELMTGDDDRTTPSLAGLLDTPVTVTSLDVTAVTAETGQFADPDYLLEPPD